MYLGACALVVRALVVGGYLCTLELVPWWLVCLVGSWLVCPLLMYLGAFVLLVGVLGMFVVGGYLHAFELVPWWLVCPWLVLVGGYLCTLELLSCWLVCPW